MSLQTIWRPIIWGLYLWFLISMGCLDRQDLGWRHDMQPQTGLQSTSSKTPAISRVLVKEGTLWQVDAKWMPGWHKRPRNTENFIGGVQHVVAINYMKLPSFLEWWSIFEPLLLLEHFSKSLSTAILIHFVYQKSHESTFFFGGWGGGSGRKELKKHHPSLSSSKHRDVQRLRFLAEQVRKWWGNDVFLW